MGSDRLPESQLPATDHSAFAASHSRAKTTGHFIYGEMSNFSDIRTIGAGSNQDAPIFFLVPWVHDRMAI